MNSIELKQYLLDNDNKLENLLKYIKLYNVRKKGKEIICSLDDEGNGTSIHIKLNNNLTFNDYKRDINGDIFTLIQEFKELSFPDTIKYINNFLGFDNSFVKIEKPKIFGGFFDKIKKHQEGIYEIKKYSNDILKQYESCGNELFQKDGISLETQKKFNIGYDMLTQRITIPAYSCEGDLIGVMGRWNGNNYEKLGISKYFPLIEYPKRLTLYGYYINYNYLVNNYVWIFESQKSIQKMYQNNIRNCVACECASISNIQVKYIQSLNPKGIIIAFDEGLDEEMFIKQCNKFKTKSNFLNYRIGYLYDKENEYLKKGSKDAPADLSLENFKKLSKKVRWII